MPTKSRTNIVFKMFGPSGGMRKVMRAEWRSKIKEGRGKRRMAGDVLGWRFLIWLLVKNRHRNDKGGMSGVEGTMLKGNVVSIKVPF